MAAPRPSISTAPQSASPGRTSSVRSSGASVHLTDALDDDDDDGDGGVVVVAPLSSAANAARRRKSSATSGGKPSTPLDDEHGERVPLTMNAQSVLMDAHDAEHDVVITQGTTTTTTTTSPGGRPTALVQPSSPRRPRPSVFFATPLAAETHGDRPLEPPDAFPDRKATSAAAASRQARRESAQGNDSSDSEGSTLIVEESTAQEAAHLKGRPRSLRQLLLVLVICVVWTAPGLICYLVFPTQCVVAGFGVLSWSILFVIATILHYVSLFIVRIVLLIISRNLNKHRNFVYFVTGTDVLVAWIVTSSVMFAVWASFHLWGVLLPDDALDVASLWWVNSILASLLVTAAGWLIKDLCLKVFSLRFQKKAYADRIENVLQAERAVVHMVQEIASWETASPSHPPSALGGLRVPQLSLHFGNLRLRRSNIEMSSLPTTTTTTTTPVRGHPVPHVSSAPDIQHVTQSVDHTAARQAARDEVVRLARLCGFKKLRSYHEFEKSAADHTRDARLLGTALFRAMLLYVDAQVDPNGASASLDEDDFDDFVSEDEDLHKVFQLFDVRRRRQVARSDMREAVEIIYTERRHLASSLHDCAAIVQTLDGVVAVVLVFALFFLYLFLFNVNVVSVLVSLSGILVSVVFAIGNSLKRLCEAVLFLFVTHAFDVGDWIVVDNENFVVEALGLMKVTVRNEDGELKYMPTNEMSVKTITNIRHSGNRRFAMALKLGRDNVEADLASIRKDLKAWAEANPSRYTTNIDVQVKNVDADGVLKVEVSCEMVGNWQDRVIGNKNLTEFNLALRRILATLVGKEAVE